LEDKNKQQSYCGGKRAAETGRCGSKDKGAGRADEGDGLTYNIPTFT